MGYYPQNLGDPRKRYISIIRSKIRVFGKIIFWIIMTPLGQNFAASTAAYDKGPNLTFHISGSKKASGLKFTIFL